MFCTKALLCGVYEWAAMACSVWTQSDTERKRLVMYVWMFGVIKEGMF